MNNAKLIFLSILLISSLTTNHFLTVVRKMSHLEQLAHSLSWFTNEKEKFNEAIKQLAHAFVVSHCTQQFNINYFHYCCP
jgi:hypothetical protein